MRLLAGGALVTSLARLITLVSIVVINGFVTHLLTKPAAGVYFQLWSAVTFAAILGQLGFRTAVVTWIARALHDDRPQDARGAATTTVRFTLVSYLTCSLLLATAVGLIKNAYPDLPLSWLGVCLSGIWLLNVGVQYALAEIFRGFSRFATAALTGGLLTNLVTSLSLGWLSYYPRVVSLDDVLTVIVVSGLLNSILVLTLVWSCTRRLPYGPALAPLAALRYAAPIVVSDVSRSAMEILDTLIVGAAMNSSQAALYALGARLSALATVPHQVLISVVAPGIVRTHAGGDKDKLARLLRRCSLLSALPALAITVCFGLLGETIVDFISGPGYAASIPIMVTSSLGHTLALAISCGGVALVLTGHQRHLMKITLLAACFCLLLQFVAASANSDLMIIVAIKGVVSSCLAIGSHYLCRQQLGVSSHAGFR
jgi:O-antigen/teichoic acid export membrane protein